MTIDCCYGGLKSSYLVVVVVGTVVVYKPVV